MGISQAGARPDELIAPGARATALAAIADSLERIGATGVVLAARDGEVVIVRSLGAVKSQGAITANALFEIASASKQFTAAALVLLAERGAVDLDGPIQSYLERVPRDCGAITVRHLLSHTSGIPAENGAEGDPTLQDQLSAFLRGGPRYPPGTHFEYSDEGFAIAAGIIERVSGKSYMEFVSKELFEPAGMQTARFTGDSLPEGGSQVIGRSGTGKPRAALEHPYYGNYGWYYKGMGGAVVNVWDLWAWDRALHGSRILSDRGKQELFKVVLEKHALGWYIDSKNGRITQYHGGGVRGFKCLVARYPNEDGALFVLLNDDQLDPRNIAGLFEEALFDGVPLLPPRPLGAPLQEILTGTFVDAAKTKVTIEAVGSTTCVYRYAAGKRPSHASGYIGLSDDDVPVLYEWRSKTPVHVRAQDGKVRVRMGEYEAPRKLP